MGWFHAKNILEDKVIGVESITGIIEPWLSKHPTAEFTEFVTGNNLQVFGSVEEYDGPIESVIALVAMRTLDVPPIFEALLAKNF